MRLICRLLWFALSLLALPAAAQSAIHHCVGSTGNPIFTDQPCTALQASPVREQKAPESAQQSTPQMLCAPTRNDLRQGVIEAFAQADANRLAGLMLWSGYGRGMAIADIQTLASLVRRPLLGVDFADDTAPENDPPPDASVSPAASPSTRLIVHLAGQPGSGAPTEMRFDTVRRAGCFWLRSAD